MHDGIWHFILYKRYLVTRKKKSTLLYSFQNAIIFQGHTSQPNIRESSHPHSIQDGNW